MSICLKIGDGAFIPDEGGPDSHSEWCEEYHPNLAYSECADVAGW